MAVKDSLKKVDEDKIAKQQAADEEAKAKEREKKKDESKGKPLNDPAIFEEKELKVESEKPKHDPDKNKE